MIRTRWWLRRLAFAVTVVIATTATHATQRATALSVTEAVELYAAGQCDAAVTRLATNSLTVAAFTRDLEAWIALGDAAGATRRRRMAAAFALDAGWTVTRGFANASLANWDPRHSTAYSPERASLTSHVAQGFVAEWIVRHLPAADAPGAAETTDRVIGLAAIGFAQDGHAWRKLAQDILPLARQRWPDEPRLRLADVLARTSEDLGTLRLRGSRRNDVLRVEGQSTRPIAPAIRAFEPLLTDPVLAGEIHLRLGYLELRRDRWAASLARFDEARAALAEPTLRAAADYLAGFVHEQRNEPDQAVAAYRRALALTPLMRNLATRLAALLYLRNERVDAYAILDRALNARPAPTDLLVVVERGDAHRVPEWIAAIRQALR